MKKYIDADAYIKYCNDKWIPLNVDAVNAQPSADVAEVNRCKTCFHYKPREYGYNCTVLDWDVNEDDFCSRWEAKDE